MNLPYNDIEKLAVVLAKLVDETNDYELLTDLEEIINSAKTLIDRAEDNLHPDLGIQLQEFVQLKRDTLAPTYNPENNIGSLLEGNRKYLFEILNELSSISMKR